MTSTQPLAQLVRRAGRAQTAEVALTEITTRARAYVPGMAVLLGVLTVAADAGSGSLLISVALAVALLLAPLVWTYLPTRNTRIAGQPRRARAPGVILASSHPAAAGRPMPRAPSRLTVARA